MKMIVISILAGALETNMEEMEMILEELVIKGRRP